MMTFEYARSQEYRSRRECRKAATKSCSANQSAPLHSLRGGHNPRLSRVSVDRFSYVRSPSIYTVLRVVEREGTWQIGNSRSASCSEQAFDQFIIMYDTCLPSTRLLRQQSWTQYHAVLEAFWMMLYHWTFLAVPRRKLHNVSITPGCYAKKIA